VGGTDSSERKQAYWLHVLRLDGADLWMLLRTDTETTPQIILRDKRHEVWLLADY
jgi:hypothetical protein